MSIITELNAAKENGNFEEVLDAMATAAEEREMHSNYVCRRSASECQTFRAIRAQYLGIYNEHHANMAATGMSEGMTAEELAGIMTADGVTEEQLRHMGTMVVSGLNMFDEVRAIVGEKSEACKWLKSADFDKGGFSSY